MVSSTASLSDTWRVGVLFSRTGLMAVTQTEHFLGTALAIQEINQAGGILGREIEVVAYDPESDPEWNPAPNPESTGNGVQDADPPAFEQPGIVTPGIDTPDGDAAAPANPMATGAAQGSTTRVQK